MPLDNVMIFKAGVYPRVVDAPEYGEDEWTADDIAAVAASYDTGYRQAPVVMGHTWTPGIPAAGYVTRLAASNGVLYADITPTDGAAGASLRKGIETGEYRQRSVELARDMDGKGKPYLMRLAVLGGEIPRVPGMAPMTFSARTHNAINLAHGARAESQPGDGENTMPIDEKELGEALAKPSVLARIFGAKARPDQFDAQIVELTAKVDALTAENADLKARLDKDAVDAKAAAAESYAAQVVAENKYPPAAKDSIREVYLAAGKDAAEKFAVTLKAMPAAMFGAKPTGEPEPEPDAFSKWLAKPEGVARKAEFVSRNKGDEAKALAELRNIYNQSRAVRV